MGNPNTGGGGSGGATGVVTPYAQGRRRPSAPAQQGRSTASQSNVYLPGPIYAHLAGPMAWNIARGSPRTIWGRGFAGTVFPPVT
jgi:hypothetical protein